MKAVVICDSVSSAKLTAKVADTIVTSLKGKDVEVSFFPMQNTKHVNLEEYDLLVLGSPTMAWAPTKDTKDFLSSLLGRNFTGKKAACFNTQIRSFISGNANKFMESKLKGSGFTISTPALKVYVRGRKGLYEIMDGELDKARGWAEGLVGPAPK